jgi:hypothetical protein
MGRKWTEDGQKMDRKWTENRQKIGRKLADDRQKMSRPLEMDQRFMTTPWPKVIVMPWNKTSRHTQPEGCRGACALMQNATS